MAVLNGSEMKPTRLGKWITVWREAGKQRWRTFDSKAAAEEHDSRMHLATRQASAPALVDSKITLAEYLTKWLARIDVKPRTRESYTTNATLHILPRLGKAKVRDLTRAHVRRFLEQRRAESSRATTRLDLAILRSCLQAAVEDQLFTANPAAGRFESLKLERKTGEIQEAVDVKAFDAEQLTVFLQTAQSSTNAYIRRMAPALLFGARTGCRISEIIGVRWQDLDLDKRRVTFRQAISRGHKGTLKSGHGRVVDLSPELVATLRALKAERAAEALAAGCSMPEEVFTTPSLTRLGERRFSLAFKRLLREAGLPGHFSPHSLRHSFASLLLQAGESVEVVSRLLGHADVSLTCRIYGRWLRLIADGIVARLDAIAPGTPVAWPTKIRRVRPLARVSRTPRKPASHQAGL